ncbi:MAG: MraY family glycosyltransferase [Planctomycetota bacterium]
MPARWAGRKLRILDAPDGVRKLQRPTPRTGGPALYAAFFGSVCLAAWLAPPGGPVAWPHARVIVPMFCGASAVLLIGLWDDVAGLRPWLKLLLTGLVAAAMYAAGYRAAVLANPFGGAVRLGYLAAPVTLLWFLGCMNAMNFIDGLDGLAGGVAVFAAAAVFAASIIFGNSSAAVLSAALAGAALGFLFLNFHPASIFLGDCGSYLLGFLIACVGLQGSTKADGGAALAIPLVALGLPVLDTALAIVRRWSAGRPLLSGSDRRHIHHRLVDAGLSQRQAALALYGVCFALAACAATMAAFEGLRGAMLVAVAAAGIGAAWAIGREEIARAARRIAGRTGAHRD